MHNSRNVYRLIVYTLAFFGRGEREGDSDTDKVREKERHREKEREGMWSEVKRKFATANAGN